MYSTDVTKKTHWAIQVQNVSSHCLSIGLLDLFDYMNIMISFMMLYQIVMDIFLKIMDTLYLQLYSSINKPNIALLYNTHSLVK